MIMEILLKQWKIIYSVWSAGLKVFVLDPTKKSVKFLTLDESVTPNRSHFGNNIGKKLFSTDNQIYPARPTLNY